MGRSLEGVALVSAGEVGDGMRRLDESAAAATGGDVTDLMWIGKVCCNLISACESAGDFERATQWCDEVKEFARRWELRTLFNVCRTQYASILVRRGTWVEAEAELAAARAVFADSRRLSAVEGTARLGELRRRQGRLDEAAALFADTPGHPLARAGMAEIALADGARTTRPASPSSSPRSIPDGSPPRPGRRARARSAVLGRERRDGAGGDARPRARRRRGGGRHDRLRSQPRRTRGGGRARARRARARRHATRGRRRAVRSRRLPFEETAARRALAGALRADGRSRLPSGEAEAARRPSARSWVPRLDRDRRRGHDGAGRPRRAHARPRAALPPRSSRSCASSPTGRSNREIAPVSSSASTRCIATSRTSSASSASRRAPPRSPAPPATGCLSSPFGPSSTVDRRWPIRAKPATRCGSRRWHGTVNRARRKPCRSSRSS